MFSLASSLNIPLSKGGFHPLVALVGAGIKVAFLVAPKAPFSIPTSSGPSPTRMIYLEPSKTSFRVDPSNASTCLAFIAASIIAVTTLVLGVLYTKGLLGRSNDHERDAKHSDGGSGGRGGGGGGGGSNGGGSGDEVPGGSGDPPGANPTYGNGNNSNVDSDGHHGVDTGEEPPPPPPPGHGVDLRMPRSWILILLVILLALLLLFLVFHWRRTIKDLVWWKTVQPAQGFWFTLAEILQGGRFGDAIIDLAERWIAIFHAVAFFMAQYTIGAVFLATTRDLWTRYLHQIHGLALVVVIYGTWSFLWFYESLLFFLPIRLWRLSIHRPILGLGITSVLCLAVGAYTWHCGGAFFPEVLAWCRLPLLPFVFRETFIYGFGFIYFSIHGLIVIIGLPSAAFLYRSAPSAFFSLLRAVV
ncbi:hypothetical protein B0H16DRAFT_187956 [Mycena metata]|uniref:Uncharacterized protein n=1 Tax=Mycena metata TaxID=1033252 RepID=A0AAD7JT88_9AGAR|nr:hypothetical protein B0H16DRAFT_187956 [Mycena metata]